MYCKARAVISLCLVASFELSQYGEITIDETYIAQFLTVEPTQNQRSQYNNGEIYLNSREKLQLSTSNAFRQGYLEQSNAQPSEAVLQLMILNKHTQTMQKTYQAYDQMVQKRYRS